MTAVWRVAAGVFQHPGVTKVRPGVGKSYLCLSGLPCVLAMTAATSLCDVDRGSWSERRSGVMMRGIYNF